MAQVLPPTEIVGQRVRALRALRKISAQELADRCAGLGHHELKRQVISNLENGRRAYVAVDELLVLAWALNVAPVLLLLPMNGAEAVQITPTVELHPTRALAWLTGEQEPPDRERRTEWRRAMDPVRLHREVRQRLWEVFRAEGRGDGRRAALRELSRVLNFMIDSGMSPPPVEQDWVSAMSEEGWLDHPEEVPALDSADPA